MSRFSSVPFFYNFRKKQLHFPLVQTFELKLSIFSLQYFQLTTSWFWRRHASGYSGLTLAKGGNRFSFKFWLSFIFRKSKALKNKLQNDNKYPECKANFNHDFPSFFTFLFIKRKHTEMTLYVTRNENRNLKIFETNLVIIRSHLLNKLRFSESLQLFLATFTAKMWIKITRNTNYRVCS